MAVLYNTSELTKSGNDTEFNIRPNFSLPVVTVRSGPLFDMAHAYYQDITIWSMMLVCIYSTVGLIGNSIVMYVYYFKWKKTKTRVFILCLAVIDFVNCSLNMPVEIAILSRPLDFDHHVICKLSRGITFILNDVGSTIFVAVAIERCMTVYYPLKSRQYTSTLAKKMALVAFIVGSAFASPSFIFYGTKTLTIRKEINGTVYNIVGKTCLISDEMEIRKDIILVYTLINFALLVFIFIILTVLYVAIGRKIYMVTCVEMEENGRNSSTSLLSKSIISAITGVTRSGNNNMYTENGSKGSLNRNRRPKASISCETSFAGENHKDETNMTSLSTSPSVTTTPSMTSSLRPRTVNSGGGNMRLSRRISRRNIQGTKKNTVMMRMVTMAFMISFTPFLVILIIRYTNPKYELGLSKSGTAVYYVFLRSYLINSMVNPFIYGFMNNRFRQMVKDMFLNILCSKCCRKSLENSQSLRVNQSVLHKEG